MRCGAERAAPDLVAGEDLEAPPLRASGDELEREDGRPRFGLVDGSELAWLELARCVLDVAVLVDVDAAVRDRRGVGDDCTTKGTSSYFVGRFGASCSRRSARSHMSATGPPLR